MITYTCVWLKSMHVSWKDPMCHPQMLCLAQIVCIMNFIAGLFQAVAMVTSSNGNIFRFTGHLCGEFTGPRWIPHTKASDADFDVYFDLRLNKRLSKQSWGWWFETPSRPLWRHRNDINWWWLIMTQSNDANIYVSVTLFYVTCLFVVT